jgi:hypothetical protein
MVVAGTTSARLNSNEETRGCSRNVYALAV